MKKISNTEIAKKLYENEKIASHFTFSEILDSIDKSRSTEEEAKKCDIREVVKNFEFGFLEEIDWKNFEISKWNWQKGLRSALKPQNKNWRKENEKRNKKLDGKI